MASIPTDLKESLSGLTESQKELVEKLYAVGQSALVDHLASSSRSIRCKLASQLESLDKDYADGGLEGYIKNAKKLLDNSRKGVNPLEGWEPSVPQGEVFELGTDDYIETEQIGMKELGSMGFVLVAGGLGERLGYSSIKVC